MVPHRRQSLPCAFYVAGRGCLDAAGHRNMRVHLLLVIIVNLLAAWLQIPLTHWLILWLCIGLVLSAEMLNTAIELAIDLTCPEEHELARRSKDIAAGAVLTVSMIALGIGLAIFARPVLQVLSESIRL
jgi:diacylglycerol kinase